jgi:hypothetical protein
MIVVMDEGRYEYVLIRDATVLVRVKQPNHEAPNKLAPELFDVRTGVQLREIHPAFEASELERGHRLSRECAATIIAGGAPFGAELEANRSNVVNITDIRQRRLDAVVADSIFDQLRVISRLLNKLLQAAEDVPKEERFWLSQQALSLIRKFSGRELSELEEIVEWLKSRPKK